MKLQQSLTYSDVLIKPNFSTIKSRSEVTLDYNFVGMDLGLPVISSNMDSVTSPALCAVLSSKGGVGALHRFQSIDKNVEQFYNSIDLSVNSKTLSKYNKKPIVSFGIGDAEYERALTLFEAGAETLLLDVAHGAGIHVVEQYDRVRARVGKNASIIVGNFDNYESLNAFLHHIKSGQLPNAIKVGVGNGGACTTRVVTGCGGGMITALMDCAQTLLPLIADGGIKASGDIAKALAAGASAVMVGSLLAGTEESPGIIKRTGRLSNGELVWPTQEMSFQDDLNLKKSLNNIFNNDYLFVTGIEKYKQYRGSASLESYEVQGKVSEHRTPEGESMLLPYKGPAGPILDSLSAGLKSAFAYTDSRSIYEFKEKAKLTQVSFATFQENHAHSKG